MRDIVGFEGLYTFDGENVIGLKRGKARKWVYDHSGRPYVNLSKDGKHTAFLKYQLVWMQYHNQAIPQGSEIHHIDGDFTNNEPSNLQLLTREEHKRLHGDKRSQAVNCFKDGKLIATYPSANEAGRQLELYNASICHCCNGKRTTCGGYQFCYANTPQTEQDGQLLFNFC